MSFFGICFLLYLYGSICDSKCESGFDWSTFPLAAVIFDWLWPKGLIVSITFSLPDHMPVVHLKKKTCKSGNTAENDGNTLLKFHRDSPPLAKASRWNLSKFVVIKHFG